MQYVPRKNFQGIPSPLQRLGLHEQLRWCRLEVPEQRRTEPAFHRRLIGPIPVAAELFTDPSELPLKARKGSSGEQQPEPLPGIGNVSNEVINPKAHRIAGKSPPFALISSASTSSTTDSGVSRWSTESRSFETC